jgi:hypothetical protein
MHNGNKLKAARELGISRCYLHRLLNQLNVIEGREAGEVADADAAEEDLELHEADVDVSREEPEVMTPAALRASAKIA